MRAWVLALLLAPWATLAGSGAQALPPPGDGDIRVLYWELQNQTQVWLTLQPKGAGGKTAPVLAFTLQFAGKRPAVRPDQVELRAYVGMIWAPRVELSFALDGGPRLQLPAAISGLPATEGSGVDSVAAAISIDMLQRLAQAKRVTGNALGVDFELDDAQRAAIGRFLVRVRSDNPGLFTR